MALTWAIVERTPELVRLATDGATLLIAPSAEPDPELHGVIARFAPHLTFGPPTRSNQRVERVATSGDERIVVGHFTRGATWIAYVLASRAPVDIAEVLTAHAGEESPYAHLAD